MPIAYCNKSRRQFLVGTGKSLLALPLLPSLLPSAARAQAAVPSKRTMLFWFDHNNHGPLWPDRSIATTPVGSSGFTETLLRNHGTASSLSPVFRHPLWNTLMSADQVTMLRGFDSSTYEGPHGNYTMAAGAGRSSEAAAGSPVPGHPTIDTLIENSQTVYPTLSTGANVTKALRIELLPIAQYFQRVGSTMQPASYFPYYDNVPLQSVRDCYNQVFSGLTASTVPQVDTTGQLKSNILNRVFESYTQFKNSRKISSDDKSRLDQHMSFISQLQANYSVAMPANSCVKPATPSSVPDQAVAIGLYLQLCAIAFQCGLTKFGSLYFETDSATYLPGLAALNPTPELGFHGMIHGGATDFEKDRQHRAFLIYWPYLADRIAQDFLTPLNTEEGSTGRTYIQNMITGMVNMGGTAPYGDGGGHSGYDSQQILIGDMNGALRSGRYYNFPMNGTGQDNLPYNTFLLTLMKLMGVPPSEFEWTSSDGRGIGNYIGFTAGNRFRSRFYQPINEILT